MGGMGFGFGGFGGMVQQPGDFLNSGRAGPDEPRPRAHPEQRLREQSQLLLSTTSATTASSTATTSDRRDPAYYRYAARPRAQRTTPTAMTVAPATAARAPGQLLQRQEPARLARRCTDGRRPEGEADGLRPGQPGRPGRGQEERGRVDRLGDRGPPEAARLRPPGPASTSGPTRRLASPTPSTCSCCRSTSRWPRRSIRRRRPRAAAHAALPRHRSRSSPTGRLRRSESTHLTAATALATTCARFLRDRSR